MAQKITSAKKCQRDTVILLFTSAITSAFAECRRELERLNQENFQKILQALCKHSIQFLGGIVFYKRESMLLLNHPIFM